MSFADLNILHTGETFWEGTYPFLDYSTGGSIEGSIRAAEANLAATTNNTIIIPEHGHPVSNRARLPAFRDMLVAVRSNVAELKKQRKSVEDIVAARPTATFDDECGRFVIEPALFTRLVHESV